MMLFAYAQPGAPASLVNLVGGFHCTGSVIML